VTAPPASPDPNASKPPAPESLSGRTIDDRFHLAEEIGEGGMATVYRAHDAVSGVDVAVKVLHAALVADATSMARLRQEAALGAQLTHPNLCNIISIGERGDVVYVVMPLLTGEALCDRAYRAAQLDLASTATFVRDISAGLHAAHDLGIVHRDLKPENVMIVANGDGTERAVLLDFGLATARLSSPGWQKLTRTGMVVGTPEFMSPEQMRGKALDQRSDIYSLAFMTYELLTGQLPVEAQTLREMAVARIKGDLIPIRTRRPDLAFPKAVETVLAKALEPDPDDRYQTAPQFGEAFWRAARSRADGGGLFGWLRR
jgi:serine/threonine-protein kinase